MYNSEMHQSKSKRPNSINNSGGIVGPSSNSSSTNFCFCFSWQCMGIVCLLVMTNMLTSFGWIIYSRHHNSGALQISIHDEIANILQATHLQSLHHVVGNDASDVKHAIPEKMEVKLPAVQPIIAVSKPDIDKAAPKENLSLEKEKKPEVKKSKSAKKNNPPESKISGTRAAARVASSSLTSVPFVEPLKPEVFEKFSKVLPMDRMPLLGAYPHTGTQPLFGVKHQGGDAIFGLATNYPTLFYKRFVGSLRKSKYTGDIVLAVSPEPKMKPGVKEYLIETNVVAYPFDVDCVGTDNCKFKDEFLGYPDPRPLRTFANIRYALYEYWLRHYNFNSYILILDFRDTFFQVDPFLSFGPFESRSPKYEFHMYEENFKVKNIGKCKFNSLWVGRCFGKPALKELQSKAVLCSGSTLGSYLAINHYVTTMLASMDRVKCWLKGIESDQGYQNYLFYNGYFDHPEMGKAVALAQGVGVVNTIGAMNGFRVPKNETGPLDTFWKIRDSEGFILNYDGTRSSCIHQWDRWYQELHRFIDTKTF